MNAGEKEVDNRMAQTHNNGMEVSRVETALFSNPLVARILGAEKEIFLVGGYLRDLLRGMRSRDIDFVVRGDPGRIVSRLFPKGEGRVIAFRQTRLVRVVVGDATIDFSELKGEIEDDLSRRDFSVNAIAWSLERGLIDPLSGMDDIRKGRLRGISEKNFMDDPLRLLRAYRFAAELGWIIDGGTRRIIRKLKQAINVSASERITLELYKLLNSESCLDGLKAALEDGIMSEIIDITHEMLRDNVKAVSRLNSFLKKLPEEFAFPVDGIFSQGLSVIGLLRAEQLLYGADMGRSRLRLSNAVRERLAAATKLLDACKMKQRLDDSEIFDLFARAEGAVMDFALLTKKMSFLRKAGRFLKIRALLSAEEVMGVTSLGPGPELGRVLHDMRRRQFLGQLKNEEDARKWLCKRANTARGHYEEEGTGAYQ